MAKHIGILTAGGDTPGLNAAIRGVGKAAQGHYGMQIIGFRDGFRGLVENRTARMDGGILSGILTTGGTILGTSRDKPHRMLFAGKKQDMTDVIVENYHANHLDALVCLGGGGTQKNALQLMEKGLNIITLPKTIDNDVALTDTTFGLILHSASPPAPLTGCTVPLTATIASSSSRSWGTVLAGWRWEQEWPGVPM